MTDNNEDARQVTTPTIKDVLSQWVKDGMKREGIKDKPPRYWTFAELGGVKNHHHHHPIDVECYSLRNVKVLLLSPQGGVPKHKRVHHALFLLVAPSSRRTKEKFKIKGVSWRKAKKILRSKVRSYENTVGADVTFTQVVPVSFIDLKMKWLDLKGDLDGDTYTPTPREVDCPMCAAGIPLAPYRGTLTGRISSVDPFSHISATPKV